MNSEYAKVICDSTHNGRRITTMEVKYWRSIHAELMTHRVFSRNAASSRAIPFFNEVKCKRCNGTGEDAPHCECYDCSGRCVVTNPKCTVGMLEDNPFIPEFIGFEQKGMQSGEQIDAVDYLKAQELIQNMLDGVMCGCKKLFEMRVHKSIINRYLEPWSYITVVITATEWNNFFNLRCHPAAEKHFQKVAGMMKQAMAESVPAELAYGDWHLPYIREEDKDDIILNYPNENTMIKLIHVSTARCARVSYLTQDGVRSIHEDLKLYERLRNPGDGVIHASPFEHAATPAHSPHYRNGNFLGWHQHRKSIVGESGEPNDVL